MFYILLTFAFFISVYVYFYFKSARIIKKLRKLPGPAPNFIFGNASLISKPIDFLQQLRNLTAEYGKTWKAKLGPIRTIVFTSDHNLMELILSSTKNIEKSREYKFLHKWLGTGLLTSGGTKWKKRRRVITPSFHFSILDGFVSVFDSVGNRLVNKLDQYVGKKSFDVFPIITLGTLDIICEAAMGTSVNALENENCEYVKCVKKMCNLIISRTFSVVKSVDLFYPLTLNYYKEKNVLKVLHDYTDSVIDKRMEDLKRNTNTIEKPIDEFKKRKLAFLDLLLQCKIDGKPLSRADLREEVDTFMFEGHDTTASAISFILYEISKNQDVQNKILQEQKDLFGNNKKSVMTQNELVDMKYLELVIKEGLRLYPSVPFFTRCLSEDIVHDGITYPRGLSICVFPFQSQRRPEYFRDPEKFFPERFEEQSGNNPYVYVPFSAGPRNCIGQKFAMLEMKSTIAKIVTNFELRPASPNHELELSAELILTSLNGIHIAMERRI